MLLSAHDCSWWQGWGSVGVLCSSWWPGCFIISLGEMVSQEVVEGVNYASLCVNHEKKYVYGCKSANEEQCERYRQGDHRQATV